jgi:hypothetical protein
LATGFELVLDSLSGAAPDFELDGRIQCKTDATIQASIAGREGVHN